MAFPKHASPIFNVNLPSSGQRVEMRPYLVGEERILYMALESEDRVQMATAIKQVLERCLITKLDVDKLPPFDLEFLFLRLRCKSVGEVTQLDLSFSSKTCQNEDYRSKGLGCGQKVTIDLSEVEVYRDPEHSAKIPLTDTMGVRMRYPTSELLERLNIIDKQTKTKPGVATDTYGEVLSVVAKCIELVYEGDEVYMADDAPFADVVSFIESLTKDQLDKILSFFKTIPMLKKQLTWKCAVCGADLSYEVKGLTGFFTSRSVMTA